MLIDSLAVIEADDVVGNVSPGLGMVGILALPDARYLVVKEEAFSHGIDAPMSSVRASHL